MGEWQVLLWCLTVMIGVVGFLRIATDELAQAHTRREKRCKRAAQSVADEDPEESDEPYEATSAVDQADAAS